MRGAAGGSVRACGRFGACLWACGAGLLGSLLALRRVRAGGLLGACMVLWCVWRSFSGGCCEGCLCGYWVLWVCGGVRAAGPLVLCT